MIVQIPLLLWIFQATILSMLLAFYTAVSLGALHGSFLRSFVSSLLAPRFWSEIITGYHSMLAHLETSSILLIPLVAGFVLAILTYNIGLVLNKYYPLPEPYSNCSSGLSLLAMWM